MSEVAILKQKLKDTQTHCDQLHKQVMELDRIRCELVNELSALKEKYGRLQSGEPRREGEN